MVKSWKDEYKNLNSFLEQVRTILVEHYQDLVVENEEITPTSVKNRFLGKDDSGYSLLELFDYHNDQMQKVLKWGTLKNYFTTKKYMVLFLEAHLKRKDIPLTLVNYPVLLAQGSLQLIPGSLYKSIFLYWGITCNMT